MLRTFEEMDAMNPTLELEDSHLSENLLEGLFIDLVSCFGLKPRLLEKRVPILTEYCYGSSTDC